MAPLNGSNHGSSLTIAVPSVGIALVDMVNTECPSQTLGTNAPIRRLYTLWLCVESSRANRVGQLLAEPEPRSFRADAEKVQRYVMVPPNNDDLG
jgi:hypothetical protein